MFELASDFFREGGWPMYPILSLGATALVLALVAARAKERAPLAPLVGLTVATVLFGLLGTALGVDASVEHVRELPPEQRWIVLVGFREALHCTTLALLLAIPTALVGTIAFHRPAPRS